MGQVHTPPIGMAMSHHYHARCRRGLEDGDYVREVPIDGVLGRVGGSARSPVSPPVDRDHPVMTSQIGDETLPDSGVGDRRRRDHQQGDVPTAEDLVVDLDTVPIDVALAVGIPGPHDASRPTKSRRRRLTLTGSLARWENAPPPPRTRRCRCLAGLPSRRHCATGFDHACRGSPGSDNPLQLSPLHRSGRAMGASSRPRGSPARSRAPSPPCPRWAWWSGPRRSPERRKTRRSLDSGRASRRGCTCPSPSEAVDKAARTSPRFAPSRRPAARRARRARL